MREMSTRICWPADAALQLKDQVGAAGDETAGVAVLGQQIQRLATVAGA